MRRAVLLTILIIVELSNAVAQSPDQQVNIYSIPTLSSTFFRYPSRESSQEIDAVYYNPAGLTSLEEGFHLHFSNQIQKISNEIDVSYFNLRNGQNQYGSILSNYIYPSVYMAYKHKKVAFYFGTMVVGGGGGLAYNNLPSGELAIADVPPALNLLFDLAGMPNYATIEDYDYDFFFEGFAYTPAFQMGVSYKPVDFLSFSLGVRALIYRIQAQGFFNNITIDAPTNGGVQDPLDYLNRGIAEKEASIGDGGGIGETQLGLLNFAATLFEDLLVNRDIDILQSGYGITPIIGINFDWKDKFFIGFKTEPRTNVELTTTINNGKDGGGIYVEDSIQTADVPGMYAIGFRYKQSEKFMLSVGHRMSFYTRARWQGREKQLKGNQMEFNVAFQYSPIKPLKLSMGYTFNTLNADDTYHTEVNYYIPSHSLAFGAAYEINPKVEIEFGVWNTFYPKMTFYKTQSVLGGFVPGFEDNITTKVPFEVHSKTFIFSVGANFHFPKKERNKDDTNSDIEDGNM